MEIPPCVLQDIGPLGPLPCSHSTFSLDLKVLNIEDQYFLQCAGLTYDMLKGFAPDILSLLDEQNDNNVKITRSVTNKPQNLKPLSYNSNRLKNNFQNIVTGIWNTLPENLQNAVSRKVFKASLKKSILDLYKEKVDCSNPRCFDMRFHDSPQRWLPFQNLTPAWFLFNKSPHYIFAHPAFLPHLVGLSRGACFLSHISIISAFISQSFISCSVNKPCYSSNLQTQHPFIPST